MRLNRVNLRTIFKPRCSKCIITIFALCFHGIRFKVKGLPGVVRQPVFLLISHIKICNHHSREFQNQASYKKAQKNKYIINIFYLVTLFK